MASIATQLKHLELNTPNKLTSPPFKQLLLAATNLQTLSINSAAFLEDELVRHFSRFDGIICTLDTWCRLV